MYFYVSSVVNFDLVIFIYNIVMEHLFSTYVTIIIKFSFLYCFLFIFFNNGSHIATLFTLLLFAVFMF